MPKGARVASGWFLLRTCQSTKISKKSFCLWYCKVQLRFLQTLSLSREYDLLNLDSKLIEYSPKCMHHWHNSVGNFKFKEIIIAPPGGGIHAPSTCSMLPRVALRVKRSWVWFWLLGMCRSVPQTSLPCCLDNPGLVGTWCIDPRLNQSLQAAAGTHYQGSKW